jgi:hypothetical protein
MKPWILALAAALATSACAFYPRKSDDFDVPTCAVYSNPLTLDVIVFDKLECDRTEDVKACLIAYGAVGPVTAAASGSVVLAGNSLYWLGNRSHCSLRAYVRRHARKA